MPTALVAQDYLGGDLQRLITVFDGKKESHYRNILDNGAIFDASRTQYPEEQDLRVTAVTHNEFNSIREKLLDEPEVRYRYNILRLKVEQIIGS